MALPVRYNLLSLGARPTSTISSVGLVAVVIATFAYLQAVTDSALNTMVGSGDPSTVIALNAAAESETVSGLGQDQINLLESAPGIEKAGGKPIISQEIVAISSAAPREAEVDASGEQVKVNAAVRGVDLEVAKLVRHARVQMLAGRGFQPGTFEVIVGEAAHKIYLEHDIGDSIELGNRGLRSFQVVGIFSTGGTAADSEIWGYVETLRDVYGRNGYSSARMVVPDEQAARKAIEFIKGPSVGLTAKTEQEYFHDLNDQTQKATQVLSIAMILIMGTAAAFAVANTMYAAVAGRTREIGMLRAIGFARTSVLLAFIIEGLLIAVLGGLLGAGASLLCDGLQRNMLPPTFTTVSYSLRITPKIMVVSLIVAVVIGLLGSILPAWRAARMNVVRALREA